MINVKTFAIVGVAIAAIVPAVAFARRRITATNARQALMRAKAAGRKVAHAPKPRKARRITRHLAKSAA